MFEAKSSRHWPISLGVSTQRCFAVALFAFGLMFAQTNSAAATALTFDRISIGTEGSPVLPLQTVSPDGDSSRLFVVGNFGDVQIYNRDTESFEAESFLDVGNLVGREFEQGLLGLAFPPDFDNSGKF